jgi:hypothetical protein
MRKEAQTQTLATERSKRAVAIAQCGTRAAASNLPLVSTGSQQDVTPETMMARMIDLLGPAAATAAAWCAFSAYCEADDIEYRFWLTVFIQLGGSA